MNSDDRNQEADETVDRWAISRQKPKKSPLSKVRL